MLNPNVSSAVDKVRTLNTLRRERSGQIAALRERQRQDKFEQEKLKQEAAREAMEDFLLLMKDQILRESYIHNRGESFALSNMFRRTGMTSACYWRSPMIPTRVIETRKAFLEAWHEMNRTFVEELESSPEFREFIVKTMRLREGS